MAGEAYNVELNLRPIDLHMKIISIETALRLMASSKFRKYGKSSNAPLIKLVAKIEAFTDKPIFSLKFGKPYTNASWASLPFAAIVKNSLKAAVSMDLESVQRRYLGKASDYTVCSAEPIGIILALEIAIHV